MRSFEDSNLCGVGEDLADERLARVIGRVRLAGKENLQAADALGEIVQTLAVAEQQRGALVRSGAAREAERENVRIEFNARACLHGRKEALFAERVRRLDHVRLDAVDRAEVLVVVPPLRDLFVEELLEGLAKATWRRGRRW